MSPLESSPTPPQFAAGIDVPSPKETILTSDTGGRKAVRREDYSLLYGPWVAGVMRVNADPGGAWGIWDSLEAFGVWQERRLGVAVLIDCATALIRGVPLTNGVDDNRDAQLRDGLDAVARVAHYGSQKYTRLNFRAGYPYSSCIASFWRHVLAHESGDITDPESGEPHLAHAAWHTMALYCFVETGVGTDDRAELPGDRSDADRATDSTDA